MASTVVELMRRRFGGKSEPPYLDGWTEKTQLNTRGELIASITGMTSPLLDKGTASASITWYGAIVRVCYYDANEGFSDYWNASVQTRTVPANVRYIRVTMPMNDIDNCYVKDNTNNRYLWKGKNI